MLGWKHQRVSYTDRPIPASGLEGRFRTDISDSP